MNFRRRAVRRDQEYAAIELDGLRLDYLLKRSSARRSLSLRVNRDGMAQVNAPWSMPMIRIEAFLRGHAGWLRQQLARHDAHAVWFDGMALPFLGGELKLVWHPSANLQGIHRQGERLLCKAGGEVLADLVRDWYRAQAQTIMASRLEHVCTRLDFSIPPWRLSDARTRWGSLSPKGVVSLNWRLVKADFEVIDYVVCHELAHFRRRDHSAAFWREVEALYPGHAEPKSRLRLEGARYLAF